MTALIALLLTAGLFAWFTRLERREQSVTVVAFLFVLVLADAVLYADQNLVPTGLLHPEYENVTFRLIDIVIPAAIVARLSRPASRHATAGTVLPWLALLAWLATAGAAGAFAGNSLTLVQFHGKVIIYLAALVVAAGVPLRQYIAPGRLERYFGWSAIVALTLIATDVAGLTISANLPLLALQDLGVMGSDAATLFSGLGALALAMGLFADESRVRLLASAVPLLATPAVADQRAAFVALALSGCAIIAGLLLSRRRVRITPTEVGLALAAATALLLTSALLSVAGNHGAKLPLQDELTTTFTSYEEVLTTRDRLYQWAAVAPMIEQRPIFGSGLGHQYVSYEPGTFTLRTRDSAHNILLDLLLRSGVVGLGLFLLALCATCASLARGWWAHGSDRAAAFALGSAAIVAGLLGKGMAESIFEKYRLAAALGLGIGAMISAGLPAQRPAERPRPRARRPRTTATGARARAPAVNAAQGAESTW